MKLPKFSHNKIVNVVLTAYTIGLVALATAGIIRCIIGLIMGDFASASYGIYN
jgi:hypothetical protein